VETVQSQQNYYHGCGDPIEAVGCPTESLGYANSTLDISGINQLIPNIPFLLVCALLIHSVCISFVLICALLYK
jgi:hypothetical protein